MGRRVVCFLPGDYRPLPNELAQPNVDAFVANLTGALRALGACPIHRRSFAPVREALRLPPLEPDHWRRTRTQQAAVR